MAHVTPIDRASSGELDGVFGFFEEAMGFLPNSVLTMATSLEESPATFAAQNLDTIGWRSGKHVNEGDGHGTA